MVRMGTSEGAARSPFTLIQWKPPQNHMARMITRRLTSINLMTKPVCKELAKSVLKIQS